MEASEIKIGSVYRDEAKKRYKVLAIENFGLIPFAKCERVNDPIAKEYLDFIPIRSLYKIEE